MSDFSENDIPDERSPARLQADAERRSRNQTVPAMVERYRQYGQPIDVEGYITG